jgi:hypothetical protein
MKDFVPYEPALALKELGFDEECLAIHSFVDGELNFMYVNTFHSNDDVNEKSAASPLYQQAFRWFREKYNLISYIHPLALLQDTKKWCYEITNFESSWDEDINLHSPEEAELACLNKLIEIVKTKQL